MARTRTLAQRLGKVPVFRSLSIDQLKSLVASAHRVNIRPRQALYEQGEAASACYVILRGAVQFGVSMGRRTAVVGLAFDHDIFGLESLRRRGRRFESATAASAGELLEIDNAALKKSLIENPRCQFDLLNYLVVKLHEKTGHAARNSHQDAETRIAAYLISQANARPPCSGTRDAALSQAELADYLALTPETFCRKVNKFRHLGWIGGSGNEYVIKRRDALQDLLDR